MDYIRRFLPLKEGIPSKNTFARVLSSLESDVFKQCFMAWIQSFRLAVREVITIDGNMLKAFVKQPSNQRFIWSVLLQRQRRVNWFWVKKKSARNPMKSQPSLRICS